MAPITIMVTPHFIAKNDGERTIVAYGIPTSLLESNSFFAACRDPEIPTKIIKLHNRKVVKLVYEDKQQADQVIERGYVTIFKTQHRAVKPRHVKSNICRVCKTVDCEKQKQLWQSTMW